MSGRPPEHDRLYAEAVATVAHELKTPLASIRGYAQMLRDDNLGPEVVREFAAEIHDGILRLARYVESILANGSAGSAGTALELCDVRLAPGLGQGLRDL